MWEVRVREKAPVITLMFKVAEVAGVNLTANSAIFEICESLKIREQKHTYSCATCGSLPPRAMWGRHLIFVLTLSLVGTELGNQSFMHHFSKVFFAMYESV